MNLLEVTGITKRFAGIAALSGVSLTVAAGEPTGLIGPNGAGKTTLFDCVCGLVRPDAGHVSFDGEDITGLAPHRRARLGIGRTFQRSELWSGMTVRDHLLVPEIARRSHGGLVADLRNRGRATGSERARADETLRLLGLADHADRAIEEISLGLGRLVELGRALATEPRLLVLDEPSSGLDPGETLALGDALETVRRERGIAYLLVEHDLELVGRVTRRLYALDAGELTAAGSTEDVMADAAVRQAYLGIVP